MMFNKTPNMRPWPRIKITEGGRNCWVQHVEGRQPDRGSAAMLLDSTDSDSKGQAWHVRKQRPRDSVNGSGKTREQWPFYPNKPLDDTPREVNMEEGWKEGKCRYQQRGSEGGCASMSTLKQKPVSTFPFSFFFASTYITTEVFRFFIEIGSDWRNLRQNAPPLLRSPSLQCPFLLTPSLLVLPSHPRDVQNGCYFRRSYDKIQISKKRRLEIHSFANYYLPYYE